METLFFYGTLRHVPLLAVVVGRDAESLQMADAVLPGCSVHAVAGEVFPMIERGGSGAPGLLVRGLSEEEVERLRFYEGGFDYDLEPVTVECNGAQVAARVFFPTPGTWQKSGPWSIDAWADACGDWAVLGAQEEMRYFGHRDRAEVDRMLPMIQARATSQILARDNLAVSPGGMTATDVVSATATTGFSGFFKLETYDLTFRRYDGQSNEMVRREVFVATDAAIVLPYDPVRDRVLLIEQFRPGPFARGDALPWQLEPIAGRIDSQEAPQSTAHREAFEEAGLKLNRLEEVSSCYASPGSSTEFFHVFVGLADLPDGIDGVSGVEAEAEDIRSFLYSFDALMRMVDEQQIVNAPLVLSALWLARHRDRLRRAA